MCGHQADKNGTALNNILCIIDKIIHNLYIELNLGNYKLMFGHQADNNGTGLKINTRAQFSTD